MPQTRYALLLVGLFAAPALAQSTPPLRPPAYPLLTHTPYFSVWAMQDGLTAAPTRH